ncbi:MAG: hypothetical protein JWO62_3272 [Acidimicrobiaceae bacterium]|nr:hypothetical protein [Acidimicrobiaceae bacterium]
MDRLPDFEILADSSSDDAYLDTGVVPRVVITAPIPITRVASFAATGQATPYRQRRPTRPSVARTSAPLGLRILVTTLLVIAIGSVGGLVAVRMHSKSSGAPRTNSPSRLPRNLAQGARSPDRAVLVSSSATAIVYRVPTSSYSIVVAVDHPCWLVVKSPAGASSSVVATTLSPSASPRSIAIHGSASITVAARVGSITITEGTKVLDVINAPVLGVAYTFLPQAERTG